MRTSKPCSIPPTPQRGEIWYVKHLWENKARFGHCVEAEKRHYGLSAHDGIACIPYKSRPAIVLGAVDDLKGEEQRFDMALLTSKAGTRRIPLSALKDLEGISYFYLRAPARVRSNFLGTRCGKVDDHTRMMIVDMIAKYLLRADSSEPIRQAPSFDITLDSAQADDEIQEV